MKRSERLKYFMNFQQDGADTLKNLYNFFTSHSNTKYPNYQKYFKEISGNIASNPVIFIFDNELSDRDKPLYKFAKHANLLGEKAAISKRLQLNVKENLFLVTNPLIDNKEESEIEDLFSEELLETTLNGRKFSREKNYNTNTHYGKEKFSKYVSQNYKSINFNKFKPILEVLSSIVDNYERN